MKQFEVFVNPVTRMRRAFPYVVVMQSDVAKLGDERLVAPLAPAVSLAGSTHRLLPNVAVAGVDHLVFVRS